MPAHAVISKSRSKKKPFKVVLIGANGEPLMTPQLLTTRINCKKNLRAVMKAFNGSGIDVKDVTGKIAVWFYLELDGLEVKK